MADYTFRTTGIPKKTITQLLLKNACVNILSPRIALSNKHRVNLNAWIDPTSTEQNIGDYLSLVIVENMCNMKGIDFEQKVKRTSHLYAVGSVLLGYQNCTVWGSGFLNNRLCGKKLPLHKIIHKIWHKTDVRAVRGPETKRILDTLGIACPEVYGDPAMLLPLFYDPTPKQKRPYVIIPHYVRAHKYSGREDVLNTQTTDWKQFIDTLVEAELVVSASLHGIILAEAYGIPAVLLDDIPGLDLLKYKDYYSSTGRDTLPMIKSIDDIPNACATLPDPQVIKNLQEGLIDSFPTDLWTK